MADDLHGLNLTTEQIQALKVLLQTPAFNQVRRQEVARGLRNEVEADWISNFMQRQQREQAPTQATVESVVQELRDRVKLDSLAKAAGTKTPPLSELEIIKSAVGEANDDTGSADLNEVVKYINDHLSSHRGYADTPAILLALREKFGPDLLDRLGLRRIKDLIEELKAKFGKQDVKNLLPSVYTGEPAKVDQSQENTTLFKTINLK